MNWVQPIVGFVYPSVILDKSKDGAWVKTLDVRSWFPEEMKNSPPLEILLEAFHVRPDGFQVLIEVAPPLRNWELLLSESLEVLEAKVPPVE